MADRVLTVRLRMEVDQANRANRQVADSLRRIGDEATRAGGLSTAGLTRLGNSAVTAGKAAAVAGAVTAGGMAAAALSIGKTGAAYNTLEQTSRAALNTLTGSASTANDQMEKLREFGKTSPFPRQIWIAAQQQLLAFGMSAEKIIPTFEAIQDAVAAAGGSGQTISEITQIIARIQSTGKVTADELNELGYRGIDAASLIGEAMGKTAGEVRADITAQAISGVQFIDMLTGAMSERFEGAAAGVKQTWAGATDRIKGAWRDISSLAMTPLIDPEGGGAAVQWANDVADALRALESRLQPVIASIEGRAGPIFDALSAKLQALAEWIRTADFGAIGRQIQAMLPAVAGVAAGFTAMGARSLPIIGDLVSGLKPLPIALIAAAMASPDLRKALMDLVTAAAPLLAAAADLTSTLAGALGPVLTAVAAMLQPIIAVIGFLADRFADLPDVIQMVVVAFAAWKALGIGSWLMQNIGVLTRFGEQMKVQTALAAMSGQQIGTMGAAYSVAATRVSAAGARISATAVSVRGAMAGAAAFMAGPWGAAIGIAATAIGILTAAQGEAQTATEGFTVEIEKSTGALTAGSVESIYQWAAGAETLTNNGAHLSDVLKDFGLTAADLTGYLTGNAEATEKVNAALASHDSAAERAAFQQFLNESKGKIADQTRVQQEAARAGSDYANATKDGADASSAAAGAADGLASSMYGVGDAADSVATRSQQLQAVLSGIFDTTFGLQQAQDGFQGGLQKLKDAFASNDRAAGKSSKSGDKYSDALKRQQKIIKDTKKQLDDLAEAQKKAEEEAAEAAKAARQRQLDEMFGKQFDVQSTMDAFQAALAQSGKDIAEGGSRALSGFGEGALSNRERLRSIVQAAQAAIQAQRNQGASADQIGQFSQGLAGQLAASASAWGLNTDEVKQYTDAILSFGSLAGQQVIPDLESVSKSFAEQRREIQENSAEQMDNAKASAASASASMGAGSAADYHSSALKGNSKSALENRDMMRQVVKQAQDELTQLHLSGAGRDELTAKGEELATQLEETGLALGFSREDLLMYTTAIKVSAAEVARYPVLTARADVAGAMTTITNFVRGVNEQMAQIQKEFSIEVRTGSEYINTRGGGHQFFADGGYFRGIGGPRDDKNLVRLSDREYVVNARDTSKNLHLLEYINSGGDVTRMPGYAQGGRVDPVNLRYFGYPSTGVAETFAALRQALMPSLGSFTGGAAGPLQWAGSQAGKPYIWGAVGPRGYDCSGFMSAITNVIQGRNPHSRRFATGSFPVGDFSAGPGNFMIGSRRGNPGHMAGTLNGVNVESRGGEGVVVGPRARGAGDRLFGGNIWHLRGFADGGRVGDAPFDLISPLGMHFEEILGSYARGTDYVPMDGLYQLHRGEAVTPASQNAGGPMVLEGRLQSDGTRFGDLVTESINKGISTGQIRLARKP